MKLTKAELFALIALNEDNPERQSLFIGELAWQRIDEIRALIPNPTGICAAEKPIYLDQKGAYSSSYVLHADHSICEHAGEVWDRDSDEVRTLKAEWANLKHIASPLNLR